MAYEYQGLWRGLQAERLERERRIPVVVPALLVENDPEPEPVTAKPSAVFGASVTLVEPGTHGMKRGEGKFMDGVWYVCPSNRVLNRRKGHV